MKSNAPQSPYILASGISVGGFSLFAGPTVWFVPLEYTSSAAVCGRLDRQSPRQTGNSSAAQFNTILWNVARKIESAISVRQQPDLLQLSWGVVSSLAWPTSTSTYLKPRQTFRIFPHCRYFTEAKCKHVNQTKIWLPVISGDRETSRWTPPWHLYDSS